MVFLLSPVCMLCCMRQKLALVKWPDLNMMALFIIMEGFNAYIVHPPKKISYNRIIEWWWVLSQTSPSVLMHCLQVRGHHVANLDPLGISCVNFDDTPVTVGFHQVGENSMSCSVSMPNNFNKSLLFCLCFPFYLSPYICPPLSTHAPLGCCLLLFLAVALPLLFLFLSPELSYYYRFAGTMLPSWTPWELWTLISLHTSPWTLSHLPIILVRSWTIPVRLFGC